VHNRFRQILDLYIDDHDATYTPHQFLYVNVLDTFDFEDDIDRYEIVDSLFVRLLDKYAVGEASVMVRHLYFS